MTGKLVSKPHRNLLMAAAVITYLLVTLGGVVCVTNSSKGCPDWPWCYGRLIPPLRQDSIIEYSHRVTALLTSLMIVASAVVSLVRTPRQRWLSWTALLSVVTLIAVSFFGAMAVLRGLPRGLAVLDLGSAVVTLMLMITGAAAAARLYASQGTSARFAWDKAGLKLTFWTGVLVFIVLVSGVLVSESGSIERCLGFPLFSAGMISEGLLGTLQIARRVLAAAAVVLVLAVVLRSMRTAERKPGRTRTALVLALALGVALVVEILTGFLLLAFGQTLALLLVYSIAASAVWSLLVWMAVQTGLVVEPV